MNEEAIQASYDLFVSQGYKKSLEEYKKLLSTNSNALKESYDTFVSDGYADSIDDYKKLMGVSGQPVPLKKKGSLESATQQTQRQNTTELPSEDGSSVTQLPKKSKADTRISKSLGQINTDLMNDTEGNVVDKLSKDQTFKDLGFSFEESTWYGDYVTVTAPDGKTKKEFSLDNFLDSKSTKQSIELQNFIFFFEFFLSI